jgi:hypothetical protein
VSAVQAQTSAPARYFESLEAAFSGATDRAGAIDYTLSVGRWPVRLSFAGPALEDVVIPALADTTPGAPAEPAATICCFDTASTGVDVPPFTWRPVDLRQRGEVEGYNDDRFRTLYHGDVLDEEGGFDALSMCDAQSRTGVFWVSNVDRVHWWERAEPVRASLHWALNGDGRNLVHAAAIGDENGVILLAGKGGAGKTTTTIACVLDGMRFVGDNYVLASFEPEPVVHALYRNVKLRPGTLELLPELESAVDSLDIEEGEKYIVDVGRWRPEQVVSGVPVRAVVVPEVIGSGETRVVPTSGIEALLALAPTTIYQLPHNGGALGAMADLARTVPTFRLELGGDVHGCPAAIRDLLRNLAEPGASA